MKKILILMVIALLCSFTTTLIVKNNVVKAESSYSYIKQIESDTQGWTWNGFYPVENDKVSRDWEHGSMQSGATGEYTFKGDYVGLYGYKGVEGGSILVSIDNQSEVNVSLYNSTDVYQQKLAEFNLTFGWHTIKISTLTQDKWHSIDFIEVNMAKEVYEEYYNLALLGEIICSVPNPTGGGNKDLNVIRNEKIYAVGTNGIGPLTYDSYDGSARKDFYMGYEYSENVKFSKLVFQEGQTWATGGWFANGAPKVQVRVSGVWQDVTLTTPINYPVSDTQADFGVNCEIFTFIFQEISGDAIRIIGLSGGTENFVSVAQIEVYGSTSAKTLHGGYDYKERISFSKEYSISCLNVTNGTLTVDKQKAEELETITITATANSGYTLKEITVNGNVINGNTFTMPEQDVVVNAVFTRIVNAYASLSVKETIGVNFYLDAIKDEVDSGAYVELTYNHNNIDYTPQIATDTIYLSDLVAEDDGSYKLSISFASGQINDKITLKMYDGQGILLYEKENYSIKEYCNTIINDSQDELLKNLCKSILNYGNMAKDYFDYDSSVPVDAPIQIDGAPTEITNQPEMVIDDKIDSLSISQISLVALSDVSVRFYFNLDNGQDFGLYHISLATQNNIGSDINYKTGYNNLGHYVEVYGIESTNLDESFILMLTYNEQTLTIKYSVINFLYQKVVTDKDTTSQSLKDLCMSIYVYNYCANTYFDSLNNSGSTFNL